MGSKKAKVLIVHNYYQLSGGEDTVVDNEKKLLEEHGHEVFFYGRDNAELNNMGLLKKLLLPVNMVFNLKTYREIKALIQNEHFDIVHVHNTLLLISPSVYYAAVSSGIPVVQTVHNFRLLCPAATFYRNNSICEDCVKTGLRCAVIHSCYRGSKMQTLACVINTKLHRFTGIHGKIHYICLTEFNKKKLLQLKQIKEDKIFVKPNFSGGDTEFIPAEQRENRMIFVGRLDPLKGIKLLLHAWKHMGTSAPELLVCGTGPLEKWCRQYVAENQLSHVRLKGFVPHTETRNLIGRSKALLLPTQWYEGFPMSIVEAFSVGTPVICSDLGNAGSIVAEGLTGCKFKYDSVEELINAVRRLGTYKNLCQKTFSEYAKRYAKEENYKKLAGIYETISWHM